MAVLNKKEEKIQAVLGRLPKKYTQEEFVAMFIKLYGKDWGKIKSAYIKQSQDKEPGTIVNMPKPDLYLKQLLDIFLTKSANAAPTAETKEEVKKTTKTKAANNAETVKVEIKSSAKNKVVVSNADEVKAKKPAAKKPAKIAKQADTEEVKTVTKRKVATKK